MAKDDTIPVTCEPQVLCVNHAASGLSRLFNLNEALIYSIKKQRSHCGKKNRGNVVLGCYPQVTIEQLENDTRTTHASYITLTTTNVLLW